MHGQPIVVRGRALGFPAVCAPLVARTTHELVSECAAVAARGPDLLEWRVDFFDAIADAGAVERTAADLKRAAGGIPILLTRRSAREGGEAIAASEAQVLQAYRAACSAGHVDLVDYEMDNDAAQVREVRELSRMAGVQLVLSFHDFRATPDAEALFRRFEQAGSLGADIAKVAVMPQSRADVLALLAATERASRALPIPIVSMAMGPLGAVTRACGWLFGSALTFAVGERASAPGQMPIADVRAVIEALRRAS